MDYNNAYEYEYEQEIDLKELMFAVLHKWKWILAFGIIFALVLGGYKSLSSYMHESNPTVKKEAEENYQKELEFYHKSMDSCTREIENLEKSILGQQQYMEESVLMNISPYDVWEARVELFVKADYDNKPDMVYQNLEFTRTLLQSYQAALTSAEFIETIADEVGIESRYLQELINITIDQDDTKINNLLMVRLRCEDEATAKKILDGILDGAAQFKNQIQTVVGTHTISEVSRSLGAKVDLDLAELQKAERNRLAELKAALTVKENELKQIEEPAASDASLGTIVKSGIKYALIGGVLGAFMVVFAVCVGFVMSDKVYSPKELKYRFKVKILGTFPGPESKSKDKVDAWLNHLEGRRQSKDINEEYSLISANISNYAKESRLLLVAGGAERTLMESVTSELTGRLTDMEVAWGGNVFNDAEGLRKLSQCDGVILVEQCGQSLYSNVELEIEKIRDMEKKIIGCIVFE